MPSCFDLKRSHNSLVRKQILLKAILQMFGVLYSAAKARPSCCRVRCGGRKEFRWSVRSEVVESKSAVPVYSGPSTDQVDAHWATMLFLICLSPLPILRNALHQTYANQSKMPVSICLSPLPAPCNAPNIPLQPPNSVDSQFHSLTATAPTR